MEERHKITRSSISFYNGPVPLSTSSGGGYVVRRPTTAEIWLDEDEVCVGCGKLMIEHPSTADRQMDAYAMRGGYIHKLCAIEEAEVVITETKLLPGATDGNELKEVIIPELE